MQYLDRVLVFIDEVEEIASHRQKRPETRVMANELLKLIPSFRDGESRLLVVATNSVRDLDHAFTRPGRFDYLLPVGPPDRSARTGIWQRYAAGITDADVDLNALAERSELFSAADIEFAARKAAQAAFERSLGGHPHPGHHSGLRGRHRRSAPVDQQCDGPRLRRGHRAVRAVLTRASYRRTPARFVRSHGLRGSAVERCLAERRAPVEDAAPGTAAGDETGLPQHRQVIGDVSR